MAALDAGHGGVFALGHDAPAVGGGQRNLHVVRVLLAQPVEAVQQFDAAVYRVHLRHVACGHEARPPLHAQVAVPDARQVQVAPARLRAQVFAVIDVAADGVGVRVHHQRRKVQVKRAFAVSVPGAGNDDLGFFHPANHAGPPWCGIRACRYAWQNSAKGVRGQVC